MSIHALSWVLKHSPARLADRLVLIVLADRADHDGANAYPSLARLVVECRLSRSQVIDSLKRLREGMPPAVRMDGYGPQGQVNYTVLMDELGSGFTPPPSKPKAAKRGGPDSGPPQAKVEGELGGPDPGPLGVQILDGGGPDPGPEPSSNRPLTVQPAPRALAHMGAREGGSIIRLDDARTITPRSAARQQRTAQRLGLFDTDESSDDAC